MTTTYATLYTIKGLCELVICESSAAGSMIERQNIGAILWAVNEKILILMVVGHYQSVVVVDGTDAELVVVHATFLESTL